MLLGGSRVFISRLAMMRSPRMINDTARTVHANPKDGSILLETSTYYENVRINWMVGLTHLTMRLNAIPPMDVPLNMIPMARARLS